MIHQFIFAGPKPGLPADAFQSYWLHFHAVDYTARIPQIRRYLVAPRVHVSYAREAPFFEGVAELWLANEQEQLASLQSPEFLQGARLDEPRWAAFWQTFVHDADPVVLLEHQGPEPSFTKLYVFLKKRPELSLDSFRVYVMKTHSETVRKIPGLRRHLVGFARPALYGFGEPRFDALEVLSFDTPDAVRGVLASESMRGVEESWRAFTDDRYRFTFVGQEHWIIRPGER